MTAKLIDGKTIASLLRSKMRELIKSKQEQGGRIPGLAVILVGENPASEIYVRNKRESCKEVGIHSVCHFLPENTKETELIELIHTLNQDKEIDGILLQ